ncbi:MAG: hypothetical protein N2319_06085 [Candidatus Kapabacteria bacterium]|nr:hypothetical protein [Candidatus Kapabacteria bacterium]
MFKNQNVFNKYLLFALIVLILSSCSREGQIPFSDAKELEKIAESYVIISLATGKFDADLVDSYFGPDSLKKIADGLNYSLDTLKLSCESLINNLNLIDTLKITENEKTRIRFLMRQIKALDTRINLLLGKKLDFDSESLAFYDVVAPVYSLKYYENILDSLENIIPGKGDLAARFKTFRNKFIIPNDKIDTVFKTALSKAREITYQYIKFLPKDESFKIEYVTEKPWGAYNWFQGNGNSLIQVNIELPIFIDRALDLACHEGYPGHHIFHTLSEEIFFKKKNWIEYSVYLLFSPQALISEGTANYAVDLAFEENEKINFEKNVLFPLAGINPSQYELYKKILYYIKKLSFISVETARRYLNGNLTMEQAIEWLMKYQLVDRSRAERSIKFYEKYRSYIINYYVGQEIVETYINSKANFLDKKEKWDIFTNLITKPTLPVDLLNKETNATTTKN